MSNKLKSSQEFKSHLISVFHELGDANDHFHFVNSLRQAVSDYEREINCAPAFWIYTIDAHVSATMSHLCRVYDCDPAAVHLPFLLEAVRDNPDVFCRQALEQRLEKGPGWEELVKHFGDPDQAQIEADIKFCRDAHPQVEKLRAWRNKVVAHLNKRVSRDFESFKKQWPLERNDIQELISKGHDMLNRCGGWYDARSFSLNLPSPWDKDYKFVLESLRMNISKRDENDDRLLKLISKGNALSGSSAT
ncbi:MAG: hypothetical protein ABSF95_15870 [Verrucomicrobiota bacterium]|jgi:hypothetical protein